MNIWSKAPPEILNAIIDNLGYQARADDNDLDSWNALKACHTVSSSFRKHALRHLFYRLTFPPPDSSPTEQLFDAIEGANEDIYRDIAPYVKEFAFILDIDYYSELESDYVQRLPSIFMTLSDAPFAIRHVYIEFPSNMGLGWPYSSTDGDELEETLTQLVASPSCQSISVIDVADFPARVIQGGGEGIRHIKLYQTSFKEGTITAGATPSYRLTNIETDDTSSILDIFCPGHSAHDFKRIGSDISSALDSVQHLDVNCIDGHKRTALEDVHKLMILPGKNLETLSIHFKSTTYPYLCPLDFSSSSNLKTLNIAVDEEDPRGVIAPIRGRRIAFGDALLETSAHSSSLESISITALAKVVDVSSNSESDPTSASITLKLHTETVEDLQRLGTELTEERYPNLKSVSFDLIVNRVPVFEDNGKLKFKGDGDGVEAERVFRGLTGVLERELQGELGEVMGLKRGVKTRISGVFGMVYVQPVGVPFS